MTDPNATRFPAVVGFSPADAARVKDTVRYVETNYRLPGPRRRGQSAPYSPLVPAQLSGALSAGSIASPTHAAGTLLVPSSPGSGAGWTATGGTNIDIYNMYTTAIPTGKTCWVQFVNGFWYLVVADC